MTISQRLSQLACFSLFRIAKGKFQDYNENADLMLHIKEKLLSFKNTTELIRYDDKIHVQNVKTISILLQIFVINIFTILIFFK